MRDSAAEILGTLLVGQIPRELVLAVEEGLMAGAARAFTASKGMDEGHLPSVVGQARHFHMNEAFHRALDANGCEPSAIRGNRIITGRCGSFRLARFNIAEGFWINGRRSQTRKQMALANRAIEPLVRPDLFERIDSAPCGVVFFVACFAGSLQMHPDCPSSIQLALPDKTMESWLFREPLPTFLERYGQASVQPDLVRPRLKSRTVDLGTKSGLK
jgi:hypothetical protein